MSTGRGTRKVPARLEDNKPIKPDKSKASFTYWNVLIYPDSNSSDWLEKLESLGYAIALSPLHDPDPQSLKPHYHLVIDCGQRVTMADVGFIFEEFSIPRPEYSRSLRASLRYLVHLDHPERQQWEEGRSAISVFNGFDLSPMGGASMIELRLWLSGAIGNCTLMDLFRSCPPDLLELFSRNVGLVRSLLDERNPRYGY